MSVSPLRWCHRRDTLISVLIIPERSSPPFSKRPSFMMNSFAACSLLLSMVGIVIFWARYAIAP